MSKNCEFFHSLIIDKTDGTLSETDRPGLEEHLHGCQQCAQDLQKMSDIKKLFSRTFPVPAPDPFLENRILARVKENLSKQGTVRIRFSPALISSFALALLLGAFFLFGNSALRQGADTRLVNYEAIDRFLITENEAVTSYTITPTPAQRYEIVGKFYDYLQDLYGAVDDESFKATYGYMESNLKELI